VRGGGRIVEDMRYVGLGYNTCNFLPARHLHGTLAEDDDAVVRGERKPGLLSRVQGQKP